MLQEFFNLINARQVHLWMYVQNWDVSFDLVNAPLGLHNIVQGA